MTCTWFVGLIGYKMMCYCFVCVNLRAFEGHDLVVSLKRSLLAH